MKRAAASTRYSTSFGIFARMPKFSPPVFPLGS
jgi:hypothetical protein